jgi:murein DD-endopeptidase MepM/ murein hydrolase activator NlpD
MRRDARRRERREKNHNLFYIGGSVVLIGLIAFAVTFVVYGNKMDKQASIDSQKIASLVKESTTDSAEVSTKVGKTVEESQNEIQNNTSKSTQNTIDNTITKATNTNNTTKIEETTKVQNTTKKEETKKEETKKVETKKEESKPEAFGFTKPVDGEIIKEYAKDNLVYSETLEEWTTHLGWDIKAEKTTVVKSSAIGKVKSIKNDPRYGLSIIIEHQDGYETLYSNLLSTEFVTVGEEVKQGQSIGTVGNTAAFEIADTAHLHFEITRNGENIDPTTLVK